MTVHHFPTTEAPTDEYIIQTRTHLPVVWYHNSTNYCAENVASAERRVQEQL
jgi:hypothetical protein